jgi:hypothetical protein
VLKQKVNLSVGVEGRTGGEHLKTSTLNDQDSVFVIEKIRSYVGMRAMQRTVHVVWVVSCPLKRVLCRACIVASSSFRDPAAEKPNDIKFLCAIVDSSPHQPLCPN